MHYPTGSLFLICMLSAAAKAAPVSEVQFQSSAAAVDRAFAKAASVQGSFPGGAVVMVRTNGLAVIRVQGVNRFGTDYSVNADTPFYVASMTKAYVGLLAARMAAKGVLPLESSIADQWPELRAPSNIDLSRVTLRQLLSHQAPFDSQALVYRTAYAEEVPANAYVGLFKKLGEAREAGFGYTNFSDLLYAAILEHKTGRSWHKCLKTDVFEPMGLSRTSTRTSEFSNVPWRHQWLGDRWHIMPPKPNSLMHAAGGIVTSPNDLGRWMQFNLRGQVPAVSELSHATFQEARTPAVNFEIKLAGLTCTGYALGWGVCSYKDNEVLIHSGGYEGARAFMLLAPGLDAGIAIMENSDSNTGTMNETFATAFLDLLLGSPSGQQHLDSFVADYPRTIRDLALERWNDVHHHQVGESWGGWKWNPTPAELARFSGSYTSEALGPARIKIENGELIARLGALPMRLIAAKSPNLFGVMETTFEGPTPLAFQVNSEGKVRAFRWKGYYFERVS